MVGYNKTKEININKSAYYYFGNMISINDFNSKNIKVDKKNHMEIFSFTTLDIKVLDE